MVEKHSGNICVHGFVFIIVHSMDIAEHGNHLERVLQELETVGLLLNAEKGALRTKSMDHKMNVHGVQARANHDVTNQ